MKKMAVLVLNHNGERFLRKCYKSLFKQTTNDFDIFLVDNNSSDKSIEFTKTFYPQIKVVNSGGDLGFTGGYNFGFKFLERKKLVYDYYLLLSNDTECDKEVITTLIKIFETKPKAGVAMPTVVNPEMIIDSMGGRYLFLSGTTFGFNSRKFFKRGRHLYKCFWASGCALAIRPKLFKKIGWFPDYFMYYEDLDISWKINNLGYDVVSTDKTYVKHIGGGSKTPAPFQLFLCERNRILCYWQNLPTYLFFIFIPTLITIRLFLLFYLGNTFSNILAKAKGFLSGFENIPQYKKTTYSLKRHLETIGNMNKIVVYD